MDTVRYFPDALDEPDRRYLLNVTSSAQQVVLDVEQSNHKRMGFPGTYRGLIQEFAAPYPSVSPDGAIGSVVADLTTDGGRYYLPRSDGWGELPLECRCHEWAEIRLPVPGKAPMCHLCDLRHQVTHIQSHIYFGSVAPPDKDMLEYWLGTLAGEAGLDLDISITARNRFELIHPGRPQVLPRRYDRIDFDRLMYLFHQIEDVRVDSMMVLVSTVGYDPVSLRFSELHRMNLRGQSEDQITMLDLAGAGYGVARIVDTDAVLPESYGSIAPLLDASLAREVAAAVRRHAINEFGPRVGSPLIGGAYDFKRVSTGLAGVELAWAAAALIDELCKREKVWESTRTSDGERGKPEESEKESDEDSGTGRSRQAAAAIIDELCPGGAPGGDENPDKEPDEKPEEPKPEKPEDKPDELKRPIRDGKDGRDLHSAITQRHKSNPMELQHHPEEGGDGAPAPPTSAEVDNPTSYRPGRGDLMDLDMEKAQAAAFGAEEPDTDDERTEALAQMAAVAQNADTMKTAMPDWAALPTEYQVQLVFPAKRGGGYGREYEETGGRAPRPVYPWEPGRGRRYVHNEFINQYLPQLERAMASNRRSRARTHLRRGSINSMDLGRVPRGYRHPFKKVDKASRRSYFVVIGVDLSGSTATRFPTADGGTHRVEDPRYEFLKWAAIQQAEMLHRIGVPFAVFGHSGCGWTGPSGYSTFTDILVGKLPNDPWDDAARDRVASWTSLAYNLDGHTMDFYRSVAESYPATDRIVLYYTDGCMPAENGTREAQILIPTVEEMAKSKRRKDRRTHLTCIAQDNDAPLAYGIDTIVLPSGLHVDRYIDLIIGGLAERLENPLSADFMPHPEKLESIKKRYGVPV